MELQKCDRCCGEEYIPPLQYIILARKREKSAFDDLTTKSKKVEDTKQYYLCHECFGAVNMVIYSPFSGQDDEETSKGDYSNLPLFRQRPRDATDLGGILKHPNDSRECLLSKRAFSRLEKFVHVGRKNSKQPPLI
jgi:hypothetical protein